MNAKYTTPAARIAELVAKYGSYRKAAEFYGFDHSHLHKIATGKKRPSDETLCNLGLDPETASYKRLCR